MASNASVPSRGLPPKPPDKGSFPLDHFRECSDAKELYLDCLKSQSMRADGDACRKLSSEYLTCRMNAQLMLREDLTKLGYHGEGDTEDARGDASKRGDAHQSEAREQNRRGFVAGVPKAPQQQPPSE